MCGIAGFLYSDSHLERQALESKVLRMVDNLKHRGFDDRGSWIDQQATIALAHTRLSILDLSPAGKQPMVSQSGRFVISLNGEIYNFIELRHDLEALGHEFRGNSDTEVTLAAFEQWGLIAALDRFIGMFAFALWDRKKRVLHLVRDRVGKKPLYYAFHAGSIYFASEIKALKAIKELNLDLDPVALDQFLSFGAIHGERTIYKQVRELTPGHRMEVDCSLNPKLVRYWMPYRKGSNNLSLDESVEELDLLLRKAIIRRLRADVPLGIFLSGGIDSGLIVAISSQELGRPLTTLSVGFEDGAFDERPMARRVAERYDTDHREIMINPNIVEIVPRIIQTYDEPFGDSSAIPSYCVAQQARQHVKVILNGDGGDELFAGYRRYLAVLFWNQFRALTKPPFDRVWLLMDKYIPQPSSFRTPFAFARRFLRGITQPEADRYHTWCADGFTWAEKQQLYRYPPLVDYGKEVVEERLRIFDKMDTLRLYMALDFTGVLPDDLLVKMDIATMTHGLEARSPFLDQELVEWAHSLPTTLLLRGRQTKPILRRLAAKYLPKEIVRAPKRGFEVPLYRWLREDLLGMSQDLLLQRAGLVNDMFTLSYREKLLAKSSQKDPARWAKQVWFLLILALWDQID